MQSTFALGRRLPSPLFCLGLALATLISLTAGTRKSGRHPQAARAPADIVVNSAAGEESGEPGKVTLPDALAKAAADPADNVIWFDAALSAGGPVTIVLSRPLALEGRGTGSDRIDGSGVPAGVVLDFADRVDAGLVVGGDRRLTCAGLTLRGGRQRTILLKDNARLTFDDVTIRDSGGPGVAGFGQASLTLIECILTRNATHGIELHGTCAGALNRVELKRNGQSGLAGFDQAAFVANECLLESNGDWNLVLTHASRAELSASTLRQGGFAGADLSDSAQLRCLECVIDESRRFGVFATGSATLELIKTRVQRSGGRGIELQERGSLVLNESVVDASDDYGVILFGQTSMTARQSIFSGNAGHGVSLRGPATGEFTACAFTRNKFSGLGCMDGGDGGRVRVTQSLFTRNGMRPIYRGPLHIAPLVPTPLSVNSQVVECMAEPNAVVELYLDPIGEAARYLRTLRADGRGRFQVSCAEVPGGQVMTASATVNGATSEFNVIAGSATEVVLAALLGRTGPFSDDGGRPDLASVVRRWKPGTHVTFQLSSAPSAAVERYLRFLVARIPDWTAGALTADLHLGSPAGAPGKSARVPIRYLSADAQPLAGRGGVTYMRWDDAGYFQPPMEILLARGADPEETCPRVLAHEVGHALGLNHTRVGLLSRMQGSTAPQAAFLNDFSPTMTFYDVLALQVLHDAQCRGGATLRELIVLAAQPTLPTAQVARAKASAEGTFSPREAAPAPPPKRTRRPR